MNFLTEKELENHLHPENNYLHDSHSDSERVPSADNSELVNAEIVHEDKAPLGRGEGNVNIPDFMRESIAALAQVEKGTVVAGMFGVSNSVVSQAKHGKISENKPDEKLQEVVTETKSKAADIALDRLLATLNRIDDSDIDCLGAKDKADVAVKMSKVYDNMREKVAEGSNIPRIIIQMSQVRNSVYYDEVEVSG